MPSNYKKLGDYIHLVNERNKNLEVETLLGVSIKKKLIPSIANTIGTDMSTYKIIKKDQFAYGTVTSRNGDKISIAILKEYEKALVSQIYLVFEVNDETEVLPDYLMMWFRRPEFDRYARYNSHGSARETFDWAEMCETELPIPSLEKQKELVEEYQIVQNRIDLNKKLCEKLEETAQTIYRHWFEDFEFPVSRHCEEEGTTDAAIPSLGYKSSGGEMVECAELGKEIPVGWKMSNLGNYLTLSQGIQVEVDEQFAEKINRNRFVRIIDYTENTEEAPRYVEIFNERYFCNKNEISIIRYGDAGKICRGLEGIIANNLFKIKSSELTNNFLFHFLINSETQKKIRASSSSSTMPAISHGTINELEIILPSDKLQIMKFEEFCLPIEKKILANISFNEKLKEMKGLLLGKMAVER